MNKEELLERKRICDQRIAKKRAQLMEAKADARLNGRYMNPRHFAQLELDIKTLAQRSQAIQSQLSAMKHEKRVNINDCFRDAAKNILPEKTFLIILEMAHDIKKSRECGGQAA